MAFGRLTPCARKVIELALRESLQLGHDYIGTEHVLLGLGPGERGRRKRILHRFPAGR